MRQDGSAMSRNRNFHTFAEPKARRALRIVRHLRDLEADVKAGSPDDVCALRADHQADDPGDGLSESTVAVRVEYPKLRATRTAYLSPQEFALLLEDPGVSARLL